MLQSPGLLPVASHIQYCSEVWELPQGTTRSQDKLSILLLQTSFIDSPLVCLQALFPSNAPNNQTPAVGDPRLAYL